MAGDQDDWNPGADFEKLCGKLQTCHMRHGLIGDHEIKEGRVGTENS